MSAAKYTQGSQKKYLALKTSFDDCGCYYAVYNIRGCHHREIKSMYIISLTVILLNVM